MLPAETNQISILIKQRRIIRSLGVLGTTRHTVPHVARNGSLAAPDSERPEDGREVGSVLLEPLHSHEFQLMQSTARRDRCRVGESASDGGGVCPSRAVPDTGCGGASRGGDVIDAGVLAESHGSSEKARGATVGECRLAFAVDGSFARARGAIGVASTSDGSGLRWPSTVLGTGCGDASYGDGAIGAGAIMVSLGSSESARGAAVGECQVAVAVGGSFARARSAIGTAATSDGSGLCLPSAVLGTGCGGASHGDGAIGADILRSSLGSSESARGAAVGEGRSAVAVGESFDGARGALGAAPVSGGGGVGPSSTALDTDCGGMSHGADATSAGVLTNWLNGSGKSAHGAAVGESRVAVAVGKSFDGARSAIGPAPASDGGGLCSSSAALEISCGGRSHGEDAIGTCALKHWLGVSESARGRRSARAEWRSHSACRSMAHAARSARRRRATATASARRARRSRRAVVACRTASTQPAPARSNTGLLRVRVRARQRSARAEWRSQSACRSMARAARAARRRRATAAASARQTRRARCSTRATAVCRTEMARSALARSRARGLRVKARAGRRSARAEWRSRSARH